MGAIYNFCDCKNQDPRLEEHIPTSQRNELLNLNNMNKFSLINSPNYGLINMLDGKSRTKLEEIKMKNAVNLIIKAYRKHRLKCSFSSTYDITNDSINLNKNKLNNSKRSLVKSSSSNIQSSDFFGKPIYIGGQNEIIKDGFGIKIMQNGAEYIGAFKNGKVEGVGKFLTKTDSFQGEFSNEQANGFGIYKHKNEIIYFGYWKNDLREKYGIEKWKDGTAYMGEFSEGEKNGMGIYVFNNGARYEGEWKDNKLEGYGMYFYLGKRIYIGEWKNNMKNGFGEFIWKSKIYFGFYSNDKKNGFGIYYCRNTRKAFMGFWKDGKQNGFGKLIDKDSINYGIWKDDQLEKCFSDEKEAFLELEKLKLYGYKQIFLFGLDDIKNYCKSDGLWEELLDYSSQFEI